MQQFSPETALRVALGAQTTIRDHPLPSTPQRGVFSGCRHCSGGIVTGHEADRRKWRVCDCVRSRLWHELAAPAIGVEPKYIDADMSGLDNAGKQQIVKRALRGDTLCLSGAVGRGKTHLAHVIMREWFRSRLEMPVLSWMLGGAACWECERTGYVSAKPCPACHGTGIYPLWAHHNTPPTLPEYVKRMIVRISCADGGGDIEPTKAGLRRLWDYSLVVIDEFGPRMRFDWYAEAMFSLLDHRYNARLQTILCTNLTPTAMATDDSMARIHSRLSELRAFVPLSGTDRRVQGGKA